MALQVQWKLMPPEVQGRGCQGYRNHRTEDLRGDSAFWRSTGPLRNQVKHAETKAEKTCRGSLPTHVLLFVGLSVFFFPVLISAHFDGFGALHVFCLPWPETVLSVHGLRRLPYVFSVALSCLCVCHLNMILDNFEAWQKDAR